MRDGHRCLSCGTRDVLTWQHREASGNGGRGKKAPALTTADGCTLCFWCNGSAEAEGQERALALGYKIRRNRGDVKASNIPVFDISDRKWYLLDEVGGRKVCAPITALELLDAAGSLTRTLTP